MQASGQNAAPWSQLAQNDDHIVLTRPPPVRLQDAIAIACLTIGYEGVRRSPQPSLRFSTMTMPTALRRRQSASGDESTRAGAADWRLEVQTPGWSLRGQAESAREHVSEARRRSPRAPEFQPRASSSSLYLHTSARESRGSGGRGSGYWRRRLEPGRERNGDSVYIVALMPRARTRVPSHVQPRGDLGQHDKS